MTAFSIIVNKFYILALHYAANFKNVKLKLYLF